MWKHFTRALSFNVNTVISTDNGNQIHIVSIQTLVFLTIIHIITLSTLDYGDTDQDGFKNCKSELGRTVFAVPYTLHITSNSYCWLLLCCSYFVICLFWCVFVCVCIWFFMWWICLVLSVFKVCFLSWPLQLYKGTFLHYI